VRPNPGVRYLDSLGQGHAGDEGRYSLLLANPRFADSLDCESIAKDLQTVVKSKKTNLMCLALFLRLLKPGGRTTVMPAIRQRQQTWRTRETRSDELPIYQQDGAMDKSF